MEKEFKNSFKALGTDISVILAGEESGPAEEIFRETRKFYEKLENTFSRFLPDSELSRFNASLGRELEASEYLLEVSKRAIKYYNETGGIFDPRVIGILESVGYWEDFGRGNFSPCGQGDWRIFSQRLENDLIIKNGRVTFKTRMDFSGIAKGYITDMAERFLKKKGFENFLIDSGGDIFASGTSAGGHDWLVEIEGVSGNSLLVQCNNKGIATSGITRRKWETDGMKKHHLINPKKCASFSFDLKSVTAISFSTSDADVWAKTLFLSGKTEGMKKADENNLGAVFLDYRGNAYVSRKMKDYLITR